MVLSDGRKSFWIRLAILIKYRSVTDTQPPSQPPSHVAVAITLNALAKASSLKSVYSGTCLAIFIEIGLYLTDPEQNISWHVFKHGVITNSLSEQVQVSMPHLKNIDSCTWNKDGGNTVIINYNYLTMQNIRVMLVMFGLC